MEEVNQSVAISVVNDVRKRTTALVISLKKTQAVGKCLYCGKSSARERNLQQKVLKDSRSRCLFLKQSNRGVLLVFSAMLEVRCKGYTIDFT